MGDLALLITAIGGVLGTVIPLLLKGRDAGSLKERITDLGKQIGELDADLGSCREDLLAAERGLHALQRLLASHGIDDPTREP